MSKIVKHLNVHIPIYLDNQIKEICKERKAKGVPNATMRIVVVELLTKALQKENLGSVPVERINEAESL